MANHPFPVIEARGPYREVGQQLGEQMKSSLQKTVDGLRDDLPAGVSWEDMLYQGRLCLTHSRAVYPQYIEELEGMAEAAGVPLDQLFLGMCEELWEVASWRSGTPRAPKGCTDFAARGPATATGGTLLAHTNDLSPSAEERLLTVRVQAGDEPEFLAVGGLGYSAGFNAAGISMTGNEVNANDIRPGVPRQLIVRAILGARRLGEAMDACLIPQRASNYNNIIADAHGEVYSMEGSATDCEAIYIEEDILAHANHYTSPPMRHFEASRGDIGGSILRHHRAMRLLRENYGQLTPERFKELLADHANYPASICKHEGVSITVFSIIIDLNQRKGWIGRGQPCQTEWVAYQLEPWTPPQAWPKPP